jgi:hypothetical protein
LTVERTRWFPNHYPWRIASAAIAFSEFVLHGLGLFPPQRDCTVAFFCANRTLLHFQMGYYTFRLTPRPNPSVSPVDTLGWSLPRPEIMAVRLDCSLFEHFRSTDASCAALAYTPQQHHAFMQTSVLCFTHYAEAPPPLLRGTQPLNEIELLTCIFLPRFFD